MDNIFKGWIKNTLIDYPGRIATVLFSGGCDFRCPMCHNEELVFNNNDEKIDLGDFWYFLEKRSGLVDGLVITGGEPTLHPDLIEFIRKAKARNLAIKLDTNGYHPGVLSHILKEGLIDYVAMDIKAPQKKYPLVSGCDNLNIDRIKQSVGIIMGADIAYEFRTTVVPFFLDDSDIISIGKWIKGARRYVLQQFRPGKTLDPSLERIQPYAPVWFEDVKRKIESSYSEVLIRGI
jgi:pyruvate formate lyase activating enzyme